MKPSVERILYEQTSAGGPNPLGVGLLVDASAREEYGLKTDRPLPKASGAGRGLVTRFDISGTAAGEWMRDAIKLVEALQ